MENYEKINVVVLGQNGVGKRNLCRVLCNFPFDQREIVTIGFDNNSFILSKGDKGFKFGLTYGGSDMIYNHAYKNIITSSDIQIIVFCKSIDGSLDYAKSCLSHIKKDKGDSCQIIFIESKCDDQNFYSPYLEIAFIEDRLGINKYIQISSKNNLGIDKLTKALWKISSKLV